MKGITISKETFFSACSTDRRHRIGRLIASLYEGRSAGSIRVFYIDTASSGMKLCVLRRGGLGLSFLERARDKIRSHTEADGTPCNPTAVDKPPPAIPHALEIHPLDHDAQCYEGSAAAAEEEDGTGSRSHPG